MMKLAIVVFAVARAACAQGQPALASTGTPMTAERAFFEFQVDRPVKKLLPAIKAVYPAELRGLGSEAKVQVQYVVDTLGIADQSSFKVLKAPNDLFVLAVKNTLATQRFSPAEIKGRKVRQVVNEQVFFPAP